MDNKFGWATGEYMSIKYLTKKNIQIFLIILLCFYLSIITVSKKSYAVQDSATSTSVDGEYQKLNDELNSLSSKKSIINIENSGFASLRPEDISLTLLSYSYENIGGNGKRLPFIIAKCSINTKEFERAAAEIRKFEPRAMIMLPSATQTVVGVVDIENHRFFPMDLLQRSKPKVRFEKLIKGAPDYILLTWEGGKIAPCDSCDTIVDADIWIWGLDSMDKTYHKLLTVKPYEHVALSGTEGDIAYVKMYKFALSDWIKDAYRELVVTTIRKIISRHGIIESEDEFNERREVYSWNEKKELYLAERIDDGKTLLSRSDSARYYSLQQVQKKVSKQPSEIAVLKLVEYIGDPSPVIAQEAKNEFIWYARKHGNERLDKSIVRALVQKILKGTQKERADASAVFPQDKILALDSADKKSLIESVNDDYNSAFLIGLSMTSEGGNKILPVLMKRLKNAQAKHSGCEVSEILTSIQAIAKQKVEFSKQHVSIIKDIVKSPLSCGLDGNTADDANEVLEELKVKR